MFYQICKKGTKKVGTVEVAKNKEARAKRATADRRQREEAEAATALEVEDAQEILKEAARSVTRERQGRQGE